MSSRALFLIWTAGICMGLLALQALMRNDPQQRHFEIFTEMAYSQASEAFTPNRWFADGKTLQPLVAGVVPRGHQPFPFGEGPDEARRAGQELVNPVAADDSAARDRGAELFRIYCLVCHDARGNGEGPVVLRGMLPPPSLHAVRATQMADGEMFHVLTRGQGNMASYAAQLSPDERWAVIQHIRRLQQEGS
ncbi:MAG: cytochrome c [Planctomycetota bacterium]|nr:MAG: cytochrome c [Planctomycetota bacterium]